MRSVDDRVKALRMTGISKGQVTRLCEEIDERTIGSGAVQFRHKRYDVEPNYPASVPIRRGPAL